MEKIWLTHYQPGVPAEINADAYPTLTDLILANCKKFAAQPALSNYGSQLTYQQLADLSRAFAAYLQQIFGLKKGDRLAIMLPNILQYPVVLLGALRAGLIIVNVNPLYTAPELIQELTDAGAETIVVLNTFAHTVQTALPQTPLKHIIVTEIGDLFSWPKSKLFNGIVKYIKKSVPRWSLPHTVSFRKVLTRGRRLPLHVVNIQSNDIACLQYTGGTTGTPKGAMLTHRNFLANILQVDAWVRPNLIEKKEIIITPLPLYHIFSLTANLFTLMQFGALNVLITNPRDIPALVKTLKKIPFTTMTGVNTLFNALLNNADFAKVDFSSLKIAYGGGAPLQHSVAERWQQLTGKVLLEGYGLTEASPVVSICPINLAEFKNSIGLPVSSTDVIFLDSNDQEVPSGEPGELCIKGPQVMKGYWQNPAETKKIFTTDGWLRTGDIGRIDNNGFIYILERKKDMILVSGFNVYPSQIEDVIASHPAVKEVAVIGIPDAITGEAVKAFVVKNDPTLTKETLLAYCHENLTGYKRPKVIEFCDSLPKTQVGKILRRELREKEKTSTSP